jgi:hypothetical protein
MVIFSVFSVLSVAMIRISYLVVRISYFPFDPPFADSGQAKKHVAREFQG